VTGGSQFHCPALRAAGGGAGRCHGPRTRPGARRFRLGVAAARAGGDLVGFRGPSHGVSTSPPPTVAARSESAAARRALRLAAPQAAWWFNVHARASAFKFGCACVRHRSRAAARRRGSLVTVALSVTMLRYCATRPVAVPASSSRHSRHGAGVRRPWRTPLLVGADRQWRERRS
jgi:hypothetical protein